MHFWEFLFPQKDLFRGWAPDRPLLQKSTFGGLAPQEYQICLLLCIVYAVRYNKERKRKPTVQEKPKK